MLATTGTPPGNPWCAAYVADCGVHALGTAYPVPRTADCDVLLAWAKRRGVLFTTGAKRGDIGLLLRSGDPDDAYHTFFVTGDADKDGRPDTIEGNSNDGGSSDGYGVFKRERIDTANLVFARWANILDDVPEELTTAYTPAPLHRVIIGAIETPGIVRDNRIYVSLRELLTGVYGKPTVTADLTWDKVSSRPFWINKSLPSAVPMYMENGTTYVGIRAAGEWLRRTVDFDPDTRTVQVREKGK